ncbi:hypothetical protein Goshw_016134, partial [Gossypium schwendimanii]|nr:hypothetical protein [Gossypium schwendimanii]
MQFGSTTAVFSKMQVAGDLHIFQFETKQGEEICVALQTSLLEKNMMEVRLESNAKGNMAITLYESLHKLQDELKLHNEELHMAEKRARRLTEEIVAFLGVLVYKFYGEELREMFGYDEHPYGFYTMAVLAIVLVGLLYGFFIAIICGQRINERHYHVLAKQELTKEYVVEDREDNKNTPELDPSHVTELRMLGVTLLWRLTFVSRMLAKGAQHTKGSVPCPAAIWFPLCSYKHAMQNKCALALVAGPINILKYLCAFCVMGTAENRLHAISDM